jgi:transcription elongation factor Elf1
MTAKDEDILASRALLKKGIALERFMESIIVNKSVKPGELFVGDRNAIIIAARRSGYGANYETLVTCPACGAKNTFSFDLNNVKVHEPLFTEELKITRNDSGTFNTIMPHTKFKVEFKLLRGEDENYLANLIQEKRKRKIIETPLSDQYKQMIVSIEGHADHSIISRYVANMPTLDSRHLRLCYKSISPDVKIENEFTCPACDHTEEVDVPFGTDFFWPNK